MDIGTRAFDVIVRRYSSTAVEGRVGNHLLWDVPFLEVVIDFHRFGVVSFPRFSLLFFSRKALFRPVLEQ